MVRKPSPYRHRLLQVLSSEKIKSTNQVLREVQDLSGKVINWHLLYKHLMDLEREGLVERLENDAGFFWRKK